MKTHIYILAIIVFQIQYAFADMITPFTESHTIDTFKDEIWVATQFSAPHCTNKGYILRFNPHENTWKVHSFVKPILCITHTDSCIWLGTYGDGLRKYQNNKWTSHKSNKSFGNYNYNIVSDADQLYLASPMGLVIYNYINNIWTLENSFTRDKTTFDIVKIDSLIWLACNNYGEIYYESPQVADEEGCIACYNIFTKKWISFSGSRKRVIKDTTYKILKGEIPSPSSDFIHLAKDTSGNLWFTFGNGVGKYNNNWMICNVKTSGIDFGHIYTIACGKLGVWVASDNGLFKYNNEKDSWVKYKNKIPGKVIRTVLVTDDAIIIKSYDPNFWEKRGVSGDTTRPEVLKRNGHFLRLNIDNNVVDIKCRDTLNWKELYNPGYMEFLTVYRNGKWRSWELTRKLMDYLTK